MCCGAAGVPMLSQPDTSDELGRRRKADQERAVDATLLASANPGCEMQLRSNLGTGNQGLRPVEISAEVLYGESI